MSSEVGAGWGGEKKTTETWTLPRGYAHPAEQQPAEHHQAY